METALGQLSGALARIRDAAQATAPAPAPAPEDEGISKAALVSTLAEAEASDGDDASVADEAPEPDAPREDAEPADPPAGEDDEAASYEDDWYRFLKHTQGPEAT